MGAVLGGTHEMSTGMAVLVNGAMGGQELLGLPG